MFLHIFSHTMSIPCSTKREHIALLPVQYALFIHHNFLQSCLLSQSFCLVGMLPWQVDICSSEVSVSSSLSVNRSSEIQVANYCCRSQVKVLFNQLRKHFVFNISRSEAFKAWQRLWRKQTESRIYLQYLLPRCSLLHILRRKWRCGQPL